MLGNIPVFCLSLLRAEARDPEPVPRLVAVSVKSVSWDKCAAP